MLPWLPSPMILFPAPPQKQGPALFKINNNNKRKKLHKCQRLMHGIITIFFFIKVIYKMDPNQ